jgi:membrane protease YdiL (CAAX protease family)
LNLSLRSSTSKKTFLILSVFSSFFWVLTTTREFILGASFEKLLVFMIGTIFLSCIFFYVFTYLLSDGERKTKVGIFEISVLIILQILIFSIEYRTKTLFMLMSSYKNQAVDISTPFFVSVSLIASTLIYIYIFPRYRNGIKLYISKNGFSGNLKIFLISFLCVSIIKFFEWKNPELGIRYPVPKFSDAENYFIWWRLSIIFIVPMAEELFFRGIFLDVLENGIGFVGASIISSAFFGLTHLYDFESGVYLALMGLGVGLIFCNLKYYTKSIFPLYFLHCSLNYDIYFRAFSLVTKR